MTRLALAAWWLIILSGPQGRAVAPLIADKAACETARAWVLRHPGGYDAVCLEAAAGAGVGHP